MMQNSLATQKDSVKIGVSSLLLKLPNLLVGLIIFLSATQFGLHFWPLSSLVYGIRIDYLAPTLYFLDCLILLFLVARRLLDRKPEQSSSRDTEGGRSLLKGAITPLLLTNLLYSQNPLATISWSLHFLLYYLFLSTLLRAPGSDPSPSRTLLKRNAWLQAKQGPAATGRRVLMGTISIVLTLSLLFQTILATTQVFLGHSVGGLLYYLGERSISVGSPGIALATFMDHVVLRAYGTFSHPNILAGYAVISLLIILRLSLRRLLDRKPEQSSSRDTEGGRSLLMGTLAPLLLTTLLVLLTQSRSAAISLFGFVVPLYLLKNIKSRILYFCILALVYLCIFPSALTPARSDLSSSQRLDLQGLSLKVISAYPIFGTGADASISTYPSVSPNTRLLQPDHNSFTLFLSWLGLVGTLVIIYCLKNCLKFDYWNLVIIAPLSPLLLLDHYLLTSPQGLFILLLYLFVAVNYSHAQKNL